MMIDSNLEQYFLQSTTTFQYDAVIVILLQYFPSQHFENVCNKKHFKMSLQEHTHFKIFARKGAFHYFCEQPSYSAV